MGSPSSENLGSANLSDSARLATTILSSIALYNSLELSILILITFKRYRGLYFWSLLASTVLGVIPATIGDALQYLELAPIWLTFVLSEIGFYFMVPGQSVVLYSRLHLVSQNYRMLRFLRYLIIVSTVTVLIPETVLYAGWAFKHSPSWDQAYRIIERIQVTWFATQEILLSTIYIVETIRLLLISPDADKRRTRILYELIAINLVAISMDISLITLEFLGFYFIQVILKTLVYSIKLKLEFAVLGILIVIVRRARTPQSLPTSQMSPDYTVSNGFISTI